MSWNYRVLRETPELFKVVSVYYEDGHITGWSDTSSDSLVWGNYDDLAGTVELLRGAFKKPVLDLHDDGQLLPMSAEAEPAPAQRIYIVEYRDGHGNEAPLHYASSWQKAVRWMDNHVEANAHTRDHYHYAIYSQGLDADDEELQDLMCFDKEGEPLEEEV